MAEKHCVIRTDLMSGTKQPADLVSLRVYDTKDNPEYIEVENGTIVELKKLEEGEREVWIANLATASSDINDCAIVAGVEKEYDERKKNLEQYTNVAGKIVRGYIPRSRNYFSVTAEGFVGGSVPAVDGTIGIGADGKLDAAGSGFGTCVAIEQAGMYTFYVIRIGKTECAG